MNTEEIKAAIALHTEKLQGLQLEIKFQKKMIKNYQELYDNRYQLQLEINDETQKDEAQN